ncbi:MAG: HipA N-terminal domain-containing protein [Verrucomicrobiota bacterium]
MSGRRGTVLVRGHECGAIEETEAGYRFHYLEEYLANPDARAVSLTLPCRIALYESEKLFPFFSGLLAEGTLREIQCRKFQIDENDDFGLLLETAGGDVIGAVSVRRADQ